MVRLKIDIFRNNANNNKNVGVKIKLIELFIEHLIFYIDTNMSLTAIHFVKKKKIKCKKS